jgi:hypothetical protein
MMHHEQGQAIGGGNAARPRSHASLLSRGMADVAKVSDNTVTVKVTPPKSGTCFVFILGGEGLICVFNNLISKWVGSVGKMVS